MEKQRSKDVNKNAAILKSATRLFLKNGYADTSMEDIAKAACVTKQTIYSHFTSKDMLFIRMMMELTQKHSTSALLMAESEKPLGIVLYEVGAGLLDTITHPDLVTTTRLIIAEGHHRPALTQSYYNDCMGYITNILTQFLDRLCQNRQLYIPDTCKAAAAFIDMIKGKYYRNAILGVPSYAADTREKQIHLRRVVADFIQHYSQNAALPTTIHYSLSPISA